MSNEREQVCLDMEFFLSKAQGWWPAQGRPGGTLPPGGSAEQSQTCTQVDPAVALAAGG
jgi:hypothetical protein